MMLGVNAAVPSGCEEEEEVVVDDMAVDVELEMGNTLERVDV